VTVGREKRREEETSSQTGGEPKELGQVKREFGFL